ncbi:MAG TPA: hypothetical protein VFA15_03235, partial [Nitrososphaera sp.]|nr:hypothetical protein [Nitrososphaera sp.]
MTLMMLSAVAIAVLAVFGSEVKAAWKTPGRAELALASGDTLDQLLSFEMPSRKVARLKTQTQEAKLYQAKSLLVSELKNWKDTGLIDSAVDAFNALITQFLKPPYVTFKPDPFAPSPPAFVPDPFTGDIHSPLQVAFYNFVQQVRLDFDIVGDYAQRAQYLTTETASLAVVVGVNQGLLALYLASIDATAVKLAAAAAASSFFNFGIGSFIAAGILVAAGAADVYLATQYILLQKQNALAFAQSQALANALLNRHLAGDVFN